MKDKTMWLTTPKSAGDYTTIDESTPELSTIGIRHICGKIYKVTAPIAKKFLLDCYLYPEEMSEFRCHQCAYVGVKTWMIRFHSQTYAIEEFNQMLEVKNKENRPLTPAQKMFMHIVPHSHGIKEGKRRFAY